jgi:hypothetical protein
MTHEQLLELIEEATTERGHDFRIQAFLLNNVDGVDSTSLRCGRCETDIRVTSGPLGSWRVDRMTVDGSVVDDRIGVYPCIAVDGSTRKEWTVVATILAEHVDPASVMEDLSVDESIRVLAVRVSS